MESLKNSLLTARASVQHLSCRLWPELSPSSPFHRVGAQCQDSDALEEELEKELQANM